MQYISVQGIRSKIPIFDDKDSLCPICSYPLSENMGCKSCNIFNKYSGAPRYFDRIFSVGSYFQKKNLDNPTEESPYNLTRLILGYKNNALAVPGCVELLAKKIEWFLIQQKIPREDIFICCVPDHIQASYKKAKLLAGDLGKRLNFTVLPLLIKLRNTEKQHNLKNSNEKFNNVKSVFSLSTIYAKAIKNKILFLIDDVVSTMASINECSKVLKNAGAKKVYVFSLGRNILLEKGGK